MKIPRDLSGDDLAEVLVPFGHRVTRQAGSHMRLTTALNGEHHVTVPRRHSLRRGTPAGVHADVSAHVGLSRDDLVSRLFGEK